MNFLLVLIFANFNANSFEIVNNMLYGDEISKTAYIGFMNDYRKYLLNLNLGMSKNVNGIMMGEMFERNETLAGVAEVRPNGITLNVLKTDPNTLKIEYYTQDDRETTELFMPKGAKMENGKFVEDPSFVTECRYFLGNEDHGFVLGSVCATDDEDALSFQKIDLHDSLFFAPFKEGVTAGSAGFHGVTNIRKLEALILK